MYQLFMQVLFLLTLTSLAHAQQTSGNITLGNDNLIAKIGVAGGGSYVCSAENSFKHVPVLGRGQSQTEAKVNAKAECDRQSNGGGFFCNIIACEQDTVNGNSTSVIFDVVRNHGSVNISFSGNVKFSCPSKGRNIEYIAKAPTKVEAAALAKAICAQDEGVRRNSEPDGFFCEAKMFDCEMIEGVRGSVGIRDFLGGIFGGTSH